MTVSIDPERHKKLRKYAILNDYTYIKDVIEEFIDTLKIQ